MSTLSSLAASPFSSTQHGILRKKHKSMSTLSSLAASPFGRSQSTASDISAQKKEGGSFLPLNLEFNKKWFEHLNLYLGYDAVRLSPVCREARKIQENLRFTHLFYVILSSPNFRYKLCNLEQPAIDHLNRETDLLNEKEKRLSGKELEETRKTLKKVGSCVEQTLIDIFTQSFRFPNLNLRTIPLFENYNGNKDEFNTDNEKFFRQIPHFRQWVENGVSPTNQASNLLLRLRALVRGKIKTLDFTGNLRFSQYFNGNLEKELFQVLQYSCQRLTDKYGVRHIIIDDKIDDDEFLRMPSIKDLLFCYLIYSFNHLSVERLNLRAQKYLTTYKLIRYLYCLNFQPFRESLNFQPFRESLNSESLKELRVASVWISDEFLKFLKGGLEILDLDWRAGLDSMANDSDFANEDEFNPQGLKIVDEDGITSALKKHHNTLQELRMTQAAITGRFLNEAGLYHLQKLHLCHCKLLEELHLAYFFARARQLEDIDLSGVNTSGASLASINSPIRKLSLRRCSNLDPDALGVFLQAKAQSLEVLQVDFAKIAGAFKSIPELPKLKEFSFSVGSFDDKEEVQTILDKCPKLDPETQDRLRQELSRLSQDEDDGDVDMAD